MEVLMESYDTSDLSKSKHELDGSTIKNLDKTEPSKENFV